jgi:hypothetical protein
MLASRSRGRAPDIRKINSKGALETLTDFGKGS